MKQTTAAKPKLVQISTGYGAPKEDGAVIPRNKYVEIRQGKPQRREQRDWPEYKTCKFTTEAIVTEGSEKGEMRKVCANSDCPVHHPKRQQQRPQADASFKAEQEKRRREEALAQVIASRTLKAIGDAVPVRLMKRDLQFLAGRLTAMLDERRLAVLIRQNHVGKAKDGEAPAKLIMAALQKADEGQLGRMLVQTVILLSLRSDSDGMRVLRDAAQAYNVDVDAIQPSSMRQWCLQAKQVLSIWALGKAARPGDGRRCGCPAAGLMSSPVPWHSGLARGLNGHDVIGITDNLGRLR